MAASRHASYERVSMLNDEQLHRIAAGVSKRLGRPARAEVRADDGLLWVIVDDGGIGCGFPLPPSEKFENFVIDWASEFLLPAVKANQISRWERFASQPLGYLYTQIRTKLGFQRHEVEELTFDEITEKLERLGPLA
jgi:hypothetical protein